MGRHVRCVRRPLAQDNLQRQQPKTPKLCAAEAVIHNNCIRIIQGTIEKSQFTIYIYIYLNTYTYYTFVCIYIYIFLNTYIYIEREHLTAMLSENTLINLAIGLTSQLFPHGCASTGGPPLLHRLRSESRAVANLRCGASFTPSVSRRTSLVSAIFCDASLDFHWTEDLRN